MIQYSLKCKEGHEFASWFQSAEAFDKLQSSGLISCPACGSEKVVKAIMAPRVRTSRDTQSKQEEPATCSENLHALTAPSSPAEAALIELKKKVQDNSEYVGTDFASEARRIHEGEAPERSIYGEAKPEEAKQLVEDGVPVAPLPFITTRKTN